VRFFILAATAMLLCTATAAMGQEGKTVELTSRTIDLAPFRTVDLKFTVIDLGGKTQSLGLKTQDLQVKETATEIRIELAADVLFDFDKSSIRPEAAAALHNVAEIINTRGKGRVARIDGHTDGKGSAAYNQRLSEQRADSVKQWLAQKEGLAQSGMITRGFGATKPVAANTKPDGSDDPEGRQKNRRVEIVLQK
jgi:outer membrane protein OmpA-like peptidoglycan-associated protein